MWLSTVVVVGYANKLGESVCKRFLDAGCTVHGVDSASGVGSPLRGEMFTAHDVSRSPLPDIPDVDVLINLIDRQNSGADIDINLKGVINSTEKYGVQPNIRSILNLSNVAAHNGAEFPEYCASKGGVVAYTINVAKRVAKYGATCNSISIGGLMSNMNDPVINDPESWEKIMSMTPLRKWISIEELVEWIYFFTMMNRSCTGQDLIVDNGEFFNHTFVWNESK